MKRLTGKATITKQQLKFIFAGVFRYYLKRMANYSDHSEDNESLGMLCDKLQNSLLPHIDKNDKHKITFSLNQIELLCLARATWDQDKGSYERNCMDYVCSKCTDDLESKKVVIFKPIIFADTDKPKQLE